METTVAKALKCRKRVIERIQRISNGIQRSNCVLLGGQRDVEDIHAALAERKTLVDLLVAVKAAMCAANRPIQEAIFRLAELKGEIAFLRQINTARGKHIVGEYMNRSVQEYEAVLSQSDVDRMAWALQLEIDGLQEQLDQFNHTHTVELPDELATVLQAE